MMFWKKQREIENAVEDYLKETENCLTAFSQALEVYFAEGLGRQFEQLTDKTHLHESRSDDKRREIERTMYAKALIPASRGDILGMLEAIDLIPNKCESVLYQLCLQNMSIPQEYKDEFKTLVRVNIESYRLLCQGVRSLFTDIRQVLPTMSRVDAKESEGDRTERRLIKTIFGAPIDKADKILLKEVILEIGSISDLAENAADRLTIIAIKQQT